MAEKDGKEIPTESQTGTSQPPIAKHDSSVLDMAFVMDCTGSMSSYIHTARENIHKIVETIVATEKIDVCLALVEYRDHPPQEDTFVTRPHDFTGKVGEMKNWLHECSASGGGDAPEAVADGLHDLLKLNWRPTATKIAILISDAPPHGLKASGDGFPNGCPAGLDPLQIVRQLAQKGITLYVVGCEPSLVPYKEFFMGLAYATGGQYVPLAGARALTQIIIGGAQEELSLEQWMEEVNREVLAEAGQDEHYDEDILASKVYEKMASKGYKAKKLTRNAVGVSNVTERAKAYSKMNAMSEASSALPPAPPPPPSLGAKGMECSSSVADDDVYEAIDEALDFGQVQRMVKKSLARNADYLPPPVRGPKHVEPDHK
ncbi:uncharacterized protein LOC121388317 [Gigantopelta aegis]|uniref:uncharacterized protein LOC121388317 n=1 Tax=Gigantopelta aegis TaxID=1735272 RepID=UPI001B88ACC2|nr:uncharacterized protein LOC121388317 [Gigantopelta aegis]